MAVTVLRGSLPPEHRICYGDGYGYGDGSGYGYGYGDGYGYGYGDGSGYGYGYGDGYGSGYGDGSGYGYGYGDGYGYGYGYGYGDGYGDGSGYGYGYGDGYGDGDLEASSPAIVQITKDQLASAGACADQLKRFVRAFPDGAAWPTDIQAALEAGLDVNWPRKTLGLLPPVVPPP